MTCYSLWLLMSKSWPLSSFLNFHMNKDKFGRRNFLSNEFPKSEIPVWTETCLHCATIGIWLHYRLRSHWNKFVIFNGCAGSFICCKLFCKNLVLQRLEWRLFIWTLSFFAWKKTIFFLLRDIFHQLRITSFKTTTDLDFVPRIIVQHRNYTYFNDVVDTES